MILRIHLQQHHSSPNTNSRLAIASTSSVRSGREIFLANIYTSTYIYRCHAQLTRALGGEHRSSDCQRHWAHDVRRRGGRGGRGGEGEGWCHALAYTSQAVRHTHSRRTLVAFWFNIYSNRTERSACSFECMCVCVLMRCAW